MIFSKSAISHKHRCNSQCLALRQFAAREDNNWQQLKGGFLALHGPGRACQSGALAARCRTNHEQGKAKRRIFR